MPKTDTTVITEPHTHSIIISIWVVRMCLVLQSRGSHIVHAIERKLPNPKADLIH
jgi:hypothetical protein